MSWLTFLSFTNHVRFVAGNAEYDVQLMLTDSSLLYLSFPAIISGGVCGSSIKRKSFIVTLLITTNGKSRYLGNLRKHTILYSPYGIPHFFLVVIHDDNNFFFFYSIPTRLPRRNHHRIFEVPRRVRNINLLNIIITSCWFNRTRARLT